MHPAFSVIFLTTLIGAGQGLFLALYTVELYAALELLPAPPAGFYTWGSLAALALLGLGLFASFFHLGHPERAWRAAARWRTSWLSREVIVLPALMATVAAYGLAHLLGLDWRIFGDALPLPGHVTLLLGGTGTVLAFALYLCTGMIYACIRFLQEWHTPLTVINYTLLGGASGFTAATALAAVLSPAHTAFLGRWAIVITLLGMATRVASLVRNARLRPKSTLESAIGVRHTRIVQRSMGFMAGSFNTREFFHGAPPVVYEAVRWAFLVLAFPLPALLLAVGLKGGGTPAFAAAFAVQYLGLLAERWFFFAQANHPQNLYYQTVG